MVVAPNQAIPYITPRLAAVVGVDAAANNIAAARLSAMRGTPAGGCTPGYSNTVAPRQIDPIQILSLRDIGRLQFV